MGLIDIGVVLVVGYFAVTGLTFLIKPEVVAKYDIAPIGAAGRTEVRCYYGALALGLGGFIAYLGSTGLGREALLGTLFIAAAILSARILGAFIDRSARESYTRTAIPVEIGFVVALAVVLIVG